MKVTGPSARQVVITDLCICLGFPLFIIGLAYISQGNRYGIFEDIGCIVEIYNAWPAYPTFLMWPLVIGLISSVYSVLTFRSFYSHRSQINEFIGSDACPMSSQRYTRLMVLASTEVMFTIPFCLWLLYRNIKNIVPYISWDNTHSYFGVIFAFPSIIWRNNPD
ncbi:fungal pheromone STE3G-protein-coupled receptor [Rickenella mellea]|uniref:Fungal pheromone STE3G-protein-coupled receptor n=1 Tax=Rickenella mellea TaxID=50990 RepID=A0A4Y7PXE1_9AGAM|nr:fungal pheromone STE3G-protein-coupled receptor [Rickenella mellea]